MFYHDACRSRILVIAGLSFGLMALGLATKPATAGGPRYGVPSGTMPWERPQHQGYREPPPSVQPRPPQTVTITIEPTKYRLEIARIPQRHDADNPNIAVIMAHVPDDASIWFDDQATSMKGMVRYFESPPLTPGKHYSYDVRVVWFEEGKWVSQTTKVPVEAGAIQCVFLVRAAQDKTNPEIAANLEKLSPEDRALAKEQAYCAVQTVNQLGVMGVPVKIMVKGEPVFLCCDGCVKKAQSNPDKTLEKVKELKAKKSKVSP